MPAEDPIDLLRRADRMVRELQGIDSGERERRLAAIAREEPDLFDRVSALLERLESGAETEAPARIGVYEILQPIGQGGSSDVYLACQRVDDAERRVAIKVLRTTAADGSLAARLARERRILARLTHPHVAAIHDLGATAEGHPYLVMEYVEGQALDAWLAENRPSLDTRLSVFRAIADAVAYAHRHLIIHRDLKPGNILVDREGRPKLLDFGIAKILDESGPDHELTSVTSLPLSLPFASPELLTGEPAGVTSDVYQLGALLYLLLTGRRPFDDQSAFGLWSAVVEGRFKRPGSLAPVPSELEAIVLKAMERDPDRRYGSVGRLSDDIEAYREGRPVAAASRGRFYRFGKFVRRHALAVSLSGGLVLAVLAFAIAVTAFSVSLERARVAAVEEQALSEATLDYLLGVFESADPARARGRELSLEDVLDEGTEQLQDRFADNPRLRYRIHATLGRVYESIEGYDVALSHFTEAHQLLTSDGMPGDDQRLAEVLSGLGRNLLKEGRTEEAALRYEQLLALPAAEDTIWETRALASLAVVDVFEGRHERALDRSRQAADAFRRQLGMDHEDSLKAHYNVAQFLLAGRGRLDPDRVREAVSVLADISGRAERLLGADHPLALQMRLFEFRARFMASEVESALAGLTRYLPLAARVLGDKHLSVLHARRFQAMSQLRMGDATVGSPALVAALEQLDSTYSRAVGDRITAWLDAAEVWAEIGDPLAISALQNARQLGALDDDIAARPALQQLVGGGSPAP